VDIIDRFVAADEIGHNKFVIYSDRTGATVYIIAGSTNWTITGVTCQNNVGIKVSSPELACLYAGEWNLLKSDSALKPVQGQTLRQRNAIQPPICVLKNSGARVQAFFAPNTKEKSKPKTPHPLPVDRAYGDRFLREAEEMAVGAFFIPGTPSYLDAFRWLLANKKLAILKVSVSAIMALMKGDTLLVRKNGERPVAVVANGLEKPVGDEIAEFEKLPDAHAIIHLKVWVKDARHKNRWKILVSIASHNGGDKASYQNDENTLYIWGHRGLGIATTVALIDIWDHYWFRTQIDFNMKGDVFQGYLATDDTWMDKYTVPDASTLRELVYLTQDVEEEDGPVPDYLQEDPDPDAIQKWIDGTYVNPHQIQPLSQTDWALPSSDAAATDNTKVKSVTSEATGHKPEAAETNPPVTAVEAVEAVAQVRDESAKVAVSTCEKPMHPVARIICNLAQAIFRRR
jgi:phosphatidylserine/phosphatidylglycerophosphate/cardiolipin synthase-like enzyme